MSTHLPQYAGCYQRRHVSLALPTVLNHKLNGPCGASGGEGRRQDTHGDIKMMWTLLTMALIPSRSQPVSHVTQNALPMDPYNWLTGDPSALNPSLTCSPPYGWLLVHFPNGSGKSRLWKAGSEYM